MLEEDAAKRARRRENRTNRRFRDKRTSRNSLRGRLVDIDCSTLPAAILTVAANTATLKLRASDYKSLLLIGADDFSCEWHDRPGHRQLQAGQRT